MEITEVRIKLMEDQSERLQAFCSVTFDHCFVVRDLKIIEGTNGPFVAMPSRKLTSHCSQCGYKNHLRAGYCNQCGQRMSGDRIIKDEDGRAKLYADIAHPINSACREMIQEKVVKEFFLEIERAKQPGYISRYDDFDLDEQFAAKNQAGRPNPPHYQKPPQDQQTKYGSNQQQETKIHTPHQKSAATPPTTPAMLPPMTDEQSMSPENRPPDFGAGIL